MTDLLEDLNDEQRKAVEHIEKPLLILAGPGTGKTRVTCKKLAYLIKEKGFQLEEILALTFSDKAAQEMQERVEELIPECVKVKISTFHSFCYDIVRENSLELGINASGEVLTEEYQQAFLLKHLDELGIETFKVPPRPIDLARTFQGAIARFKQENITIKRLEGYHREKEEQGISDEETLKLKDFARAYRAYEEFKKEKGLIDFGDMQLFTLQLFEERPEILKRYRERIRYIIVDEFQDTDFIQLQILFKLSPEGNITIVGDDDQSIYRFRGAYLTNIREFRSHYEERGILPEQIVLKTNYRCTGNIQKVAGNLIKNNPERADKEMVTKKDEGSPVHIVLYHNDWEQAKGITKTIQDLHEKGRAWEDSAVLVRRRKDARPIIEQFEKAGIPFEILGSRQYFREPIIRAVVSYLKMLSDPVRNQPALGHILMRPLHGILPGEIPRLSRYAKDKNISLWEALGNLDDFEGDATHFRRFRKEIDTLFATKGARGLLELVRALLFSRAFLKTEIGHDNRENIRLLNRFLKLTTGFLEIYPDASLEEFLTHLDALRDLGLEDESTEPGVGKVHLMTVHGSKGKEFPVVFIPCLNQNKFPSRYRQYKIEIPNELADGLTPVGSPDDLHEQEERRLLYVAITRGKDEAFLSYCKRYGNNKKDTPLSIYLTEIFDSNESYELKEIAETGEELEERSSSEEDAIFHRIITGVQRGEWQDAIDGITAMAMTEEADVSSLWIPVNMSLQEYKEGLNLLHHLPEKEHLEDVVYSPSRLKMYEDCPKKYWYNYVLKIPGEMKPYFALGGNVHKVIELITKRLKDGQDVSNEEALAILDSVWKPSDYESAIKEQQDRKDAEEMIRQFLIHQTGKDSKIVDVEGWIELDIEGRKMRGKVDRIDDVGESLKVIDYKSSKQQTSRPQLKKDFQMALYWLGVERAYDKPVSQVGHWYLRMDREWMVEITPEELEEVKQRALRVIEEIEKGEFGATPGYQVCRYCDYGDLCDEKGKER